MKVAIFLDVDKTITKRNIQESYAIALGVKDRYDEIEKDFQDKIIDATGFGDRLIPPFREKGFSKTRAEEFFHTVELRDGVDRLLALQKKGVDIFLVSSGPNYYVKVLGQRKGIPDDRILSSEYIFDNTGVISECHAVEDQDKVQFVGDRLRDYDITIGIGDNDRHDKFVAGCTIAMFMEPQEKYFHAPHFNAVCTLVEALLKRPNLESKSAEIGSITLADLRKLTLKMLLSKMAVDVWAGLVAALVAVFFAGVAFNSWLSQPTKGNSPPSAAVAPAPNSPRASP
jgi:phosphoserine phosphatase